MLYFHQDPQSIYRGTFFDCVKSETYKQAIIVHGVSGFGFQLQSKGSKKDRSALSLNLNIVTKDLMSSVLLKE